MGKPGEWRREIYITDHGRSGEQRLAVHPRAGRPGQRFTLPGQWSGLGLGDSRPKKEPLATQVEEIEVEQRSLELYQALVAAQD